MVRIKADGISRIRYSVLSSQAKIGMIVEKQLFFIFCYYQPNKNVFKISNKNNY